MKIHLFLLLSFLLIIGCKESTSEQESKITNSEDYNNYLAIQKARTTSPYFELWNSKITTDSVELPSFAAVAGQYNMFFESTGNIAYLKKAEQSLEKAVKVANIDKEIYYRSLARNYISQHKFKEALVYADSAAQLSKNIPATQHLLFDVYMELGNYTKADSIKKLFADPQDFNYIIRAAKWNDYKGKLDMTIMFMERAKEKAEASKNRAMLLWVYSNIADYYGHDGRIEDSYEHYLKTLEIDSSNAYAKKGIAWIAYSKDNNSVEAQRILDSVLKAHVSPDYYLLKAEIAEFQNDEKAKKDAMDSFWKLSNNPGYGNMYNTYKIALFAGDPATKKEALALAEQEIKNRATPETYQLLALANLVNGNKEKALKIINDHVIDKTFEPTALLTIAKIYKANMMPDMVKDIKEELLEAGYEMGPVKLREIHSL
ncbi:tetratricopeptide repeat protein [Gillisia sp. Q332]|uniref:tetratricopeptide repeat protein n=1 Tax=Gillisia xinjiangensis TaxID=3384765 RepID=UPI003918DDD7